MGKVTVIAGRNGSGKTLYIEQLRRQLASDRVRYIAFTDSYGVNVTTSTTRHLPLANYCNVPTSCPAATLKNVG